MGYVCNANCICNAVQDTPEYQTPVICTSFDNKQLWCHGYTGGNSRIYKCQGHRALCPANRLAEYEIYGVGSLIKASQFNTIKRIIHAEIEDRQKHLFYTDLEDYNVSNPTSDFNNDTIKSLKSKTYIKTEQPIEHLVNQLIILNNNINNKKDYKLGKKDSDLKTPNKGDVVYFEDINLIQSSLNRDVQDCICHTDCNAFKIYAQYDPTYCACYGNCGCYYAGSGRNFSTTNKIDNPGQQNCNNIPNQYS